MITLIILSAYRCSLTKEQNMQRSTEMREELRELGLTFTDCIGAYREEGHDNYEREVSHIVELKTKRDVALMETLARRFNQDSILEIDDEAKAYLHMINGDTEGLGMFVMTSKDRAVNNGCYTYVNGTYYICK